jgi:Fe-S cluster assembly protein SufD
MSKNSVSIEHCESEFERWLELRKSTELPSITSLRKKGFELFRELGIPHRKIEDWMYTPVGALLESKYNLAIKMSDVSEYIEKLNASIYKGQTSGRLVFINGHCESSLSRLPSVSNDSFIGSVKQAIADPRWADLLVAHWHKQLEKPTTNPFSLLNMAMTSDGALIVLPQAYHLEAPMELVFVSVPTSHKVASHPRNLIVAAAKSRLCIIETHIALGCDDYWSNPFTSFVLGEGSEVEHYKIQREHRTAWHLAHTQAELVEASNFQSSLFAFGGRTARHEYELKLSGIGGKCNLDGLYISNTNQHLCNRIQIEHAAPHCRSNQFFKGIINERASGVFNGKILVRPHAQKTDAYQTNQALLLSEDAVIYSRPQLEIFADDVKCSHGATSGYLDDEALFYMRSRGINRSDAEIYLTRAFANEVIQRVADQDLKTYLEQILDTELQSFIG